MKCSNKVKETNSSTIAKVIKRNNGPLFISWIAISYLYGQPAMHPTQGMSLAADIRSRGSCMVWLEPHLVRRNGLYFILKGRVFVNILIQNIRVHFEAMYGTNPVC